ncbi:hypothetical protein JCM8547_007799 [Rhodosporidiobolus lusitaniae]
MARGKGTPRRNQLAQADDDFSPTSPPPSSSSPSSRRTTASLNSSPARSAYTIAQANTPAAQGGTQAQKKERGPLSAEQETQYHVRLRALLVEHKKARRSWSELVIRGLVGRVRAAFDLWTDIEIALRAIEKNSTSARAVRAGYLFAQSAKLSEQVAAVEAVFVNLCEVAAVFSSICERAEYLVVEASKVKGTAWAFQQPLWVTWPLSRFVDGLFALSQPYQDSLALIRSLLDTLITFPPLPSYLSQSASTPALASSPSTVIATADSSSAKPSSTSTATGDTLPERPSPEQIQGAMSLLVTQPLLPGKLMSGGSEAWEEVLAVEVGGWA